MTIMLIGEAWGKDEEEQGKPFVGSSGKFLRLLLHQVGISYADAYVTNVFNLRPRPTNDIKNLCGPKALGIPGWPALQQGKYILAKYAGEVDRLLTEVENVQPTLIIAFGASAAWALLRTSGIKSIRGTLFYHTTRSGKQIKVLPTYHPAAVLRDYTLRPILLADLDKAKREATFPEIRRPDRTIWIEPDLSDLDRFEQEYILPADSLSIDIETAGDQITCVGFAPREDIALVVPFLDYEKIGGNYWETLAEELRVWAWVRRMCALPKAVVGQNIIYDMKFLWMQYGIPMPHMTNDTMLLHHAMQPEMDKGLGFLASIYTDEASWKFMRKTQTVKRED